VKRCTHCGGEKPLDGFPPSKRTSDGRSSWCRVCVNASVRVWRERNRERVAAYYRRVVHEPRACIQCGESFVPGRSDALVCSTVCRWRRDRKLKKRRLSGSP
jgi:hypothetical protein